MRLANFPAHGDGKASHNFPLIVFYAASLFVSLVLLCAFRHSAEVLKNFKCWGEAASWETAESSLALCMMSPFQGRKPMGTQPRVIRLHSKTAWFYDSILSRYDQRTIFSAARIFFFHFLPGTATAHPMPTRAMKEEFWKRR